MIRICIFCEGGTEKNYIQSLNRLLRDEGISDITLTAKNLSGVSASNYISKIKQYKAHELKYFTDFYSWLDFDIFKRANKVKGEIQARINGISFYKKTVTSLFNHMNGEDFIILHEEDAKIDKWRQICNNHNHFKTPMTEDIYLPLFKELIANYKKGEISNLTKEKLQICIKNIKKATVPFSSDMEKILEIILGKIQ
jgi:hypothetical protein